MELDLSGRRALVCGASVGIGCAIAEQLAQQGANLVVLARSKQKLEELVDSLPRSHQHRVLVGDLSHYQAVLADLDDILDQEGPIEILINNTGGPSPGPLTDAADEAFEKALTQHLLSASNLVRKLLPGMIDAGYGRVIQILSTSVRIPIPNLGVSNTIRGAMASWSKTLASEVGPYGITVNNILPGFTATERLSSLQEATARRLGKSVEEVKAMWKSQVPLGRFADPHEVANAVGFLASPSASYITGESIRVDGGRTGSI